MSDIILRLGASVDSSLALAFKSAEETAKRSGAAIGQTGKKAGAEFAKGAGEGPRTLELKLKALADRAKDASRGVETPFVSALNKMASEAKSKLGDVSQQFTRMARQAETEVRRIERAQSRIGLGVGPAPKLAPPPKPAPTPKPGVWRRDVSGWGREARGMAFSGARGVASSGMSFGARMLGDVARGAGLDLDVSSHVQRNVELERRTVDLSNSGYMPGQEGQNGVRQDPKKLAADVREAANGAAYSTTAAAEGLAAFVGKTGDLKLGREVFKDLAMLSRATGTELEHMVAAAGEVSNSMGNVPDKGEKIVGVMRAVAAQGKLGAVEIKDMANRLGVLAAAAPQFEGSFTDNMAMMGALAQSARQGGGSTSAAQSALSVQSFVSTFGKNARYENFKAAGIDVYSKSDPGKIRNAQSLITEALQKTTTKGTPADPTKLNKLFMDVRAQSAVRGFANIYRDSYNRTRGTDQEKMVAATAAVTAEFERLKQASMAQGEVAAAFASAMQTDEAKMQVLNNKLQEHAQQLQAAVIPALLEFAPALLGATKGIVSLTESLFGITPDIKRQKAMMDSTAEAEEMNKRMNRGIGLGMISGEDDKAFAKKQQELQAKLDAAQVAAAAGRERSVIGGMSITDLLNPMAMGRMGERAINEVSGVNDTEQKNREAEVAILKTEIENLNRTSDRMAQALMGGRLVVNVANFQDMPKFTQGATVDQSGRDTPPPPKK